MRMLSAFSRPSFIPLPFYVSASRPAFDFGQARCVSQLGCAPCAEYLKLYFRTLI